MEKNPATLREAACALGVNEAWLRQECEAGRLPHLRAGRSILLDLTLIRRLLLQRAQKAPEAAALDRAGDEDPGEAPRDDLQRARDERPVTPDRLVALTRSLLAELTPEQMAKLRAELRCGELLSELERTKPQDARIAGNVAGDSPSPYRTAIEESGAKERDARPAPRKPEDGEHGGGHD